MNMTPEYHCTAQHPWFINPYLFYGDSPLSASTFSSILLTRWTVVYALKETKHRVNCEENADEVGSVFGALVHPFVSLHHIALAGMLWAHHP